MFSYQNVWIWTFENKGGPHFLSHKWEAFNDVAWYSLRAYKIAIKVYNCSIETVQSLFKTQRASLILMNPSTVDIGFEAIEKYLRWTMIFIYYLLFDYFYIFYRRNNFMYKAGLLRLIYCFVIVLEWLFYYWLHMITSCCKL